MERDRNWEAVIIGGDRREIELYRLWSCSGKKIKMFGFELSSLIDPAAKAGIGDIGKASVLIFPLSGIKEDGTVTGLYAENPIQIRSMIGNIGPETLILSGAVAPPIVRLLAGHGKIVNTAADQELAVLNAIPTAEGAIQKAMEMSEITINGSRALVMGLGRCGTALAKALQGLEACVTVLVRRRESVALAEELGFKAAFVKQLPEAAAGVDFIFNTVPALLLTSPILEKLNKDTLIFDLASSPGGTDFQAAAGLGITALLLPGLPGRVAPKSSGRFLAEVYQTIIDRYR